MSAEAVNALLINEAPAEEQGVEVDQWGRYKIPDPTTGKVRGWTRATTLTKILDDESGLAKWNDRHLALGIGRREDLFAVAASVATASEPEDKKALDGVIESAREAAAQSARANVGTALHGFTQRLDLGEPGVEVPGPWQADVSAYLEALKAYGMWPHEQHVERVVVVPELNTAGTFDRLLMGDGWSLPRIGDLKTGSVTNKGRAFAVQLAIYAHATHWFDPKTRELHPMPEVDKEVGIIVHLPAGEGRCEVIEVDLVAGWEAAKLAHAVQLWRKRNDLCAPMSRWENTSLAAHLPPVDVDGSPHQYKEEPEPKAPKPKPEKKPKPKCVDCDRTITKKTGEYQFVDDTTGEIIHPLCENDFNARTTPALTTRLCEVCEVEVEVEAWSEHVDKHLFDDRVEFVKARIRFVQSHDLGDELGEVWVNACRDIPTFKQGGPRSHEDIDRISGACALVEAVHSLPFSDITDPARKQQTSTEQWTRGTTTND